MSSREPDSELRTLLDRCVKCGLCLPECPTYRLASDENESPRGRLALIEGLVDGRLEPDRTLAGHLESCLHCRRCERVCPSQVPYGHLIDAGLARVPRRQTPMLARLLRHPRLLGIATAMARSVPATLSRPLPGLHRLHDGIRALARQGTPRDTRRSATGRARIGLFPGCVGPALQPGTLFAATRLLERAGFSVVIPDDAACCGALDAHAGNAARAARLATRNRAAFAGVDRVISLASGCGIHLADYDPPLPAPHHDIVRFLVEEGIAASLQFSALQRHVAIHVPCSVENVYRGGDWTQRLLARVPGVHLSTLGIPGQCCGAAGDHMLRQPRRAAQLREPLLDAADSLQPDIIVSQNIGCALHIAAGLAERGRQIAVMHPVDLLARQLA